MRCAIYTILLAASVASADEVSDAMKMLKNRSPLVRTNGAERILRMGPRAKKAASLLVKCTADDSEKVRETCGKALIALGNAAAKPMLKALRTSKNGAQRLVIAQAIAKIGRGMAEHSTTLAGRLDDPNEEVRLALAEALSKMTPESLPGLIQALGDANADKRSAATVALGKSGAAALPFLTDALESKKPGLRAGGAEALGRMGAKAGRSGRALDSLLQDPEPQVRAAAAAALGKIRMRPEVCVPALIKLLEDSDPNVQLAAADAAARFGEDAATPLVEALARSGIAHARLALRRLGRAAIDALEEGCESKNASVRAESVRLLVVVAPQSPLHVPPIAELLSDEQVSVRRAACDALARRGAETQVEALVRLAGEKDATVRAAAIRALGTVLDDDAVPPKLKQAALDPNDEVRLAAEAAQWDRGQPSKALSLALHLLAAEDGQARLAACAVLARMGRAAEPAIPQLLLLLEVHPSVEVVDAVGAITAAHGNGILGSAQRFKKAPRATREAIDNALDWLARHQDTKKSGINDADGRWHSSEFVKHHDDGVLTGPGYPYYSAGVTGLAISAYLATGRTDDPAVLAGLDYLIGAQRNNGLFCPPVSQHFLIDHAFATIALCEAWILRGDPRCRAAAERAVRYCEYARNLELAWRYEPRGGENDTNVTTAMLHALALAERGGIDVDPDAFRGGARLLHSMTDSAIGRVGYNSRGGWPARPEGMQDSYPPDQSCSMSAAGAWGLELAGRHAALPPTMSKTRALCMELKPRWKPGFIDMYAWYYGSLTMHAAQGKDWDRWLSALTGALTPHQATKPSALAGSWHPVGAWGVDGGRVYSTAVCALALATPYRMGPNFIDAKPTGSFADAAKALRKVARSADARIAERATLWLRRAGG